MSLAQSENCPRIWGQRLSGGRGGWDTTQNWLWGWGMRVTVCRAVALIGHPADRRVALRLPDESGVPVVVSGYALSLPEDREGNKGLRSLCGLLSGSRAIKFPQFCYGGREGRIQHLHHKWLNRRSLSALPGSLAGPARECGRQHEDWRGKAA